MRAGTVADPANYEKQATDVGSATVPTNDSKEVSRR